MFDQVNCTSAPPNIASDAGIAGAGVLLSFTITSLIALLLSATLILQSPPKPSTIVRKLLNGYSDQQIMTGIGIQAVGLAKAASIAPYHFFLVWLLSLLSAATHNAALLALAGDFRRDWVLRWVRQALMGVNLVLSCVYGVFVLRSKIGGLPATMPVACAWQRTSASGPAADVGGAYVATILTIAGNVAVFALATWYLHSRAVGQGFFRLVQVVGLGLMAVSAVGAAIRAFLLSQAFGTPDVAIRDEGEKEWSFGQVLGLLLLVLPLVSAVEIYRGEIAVVTDGEEGERLVGGDREMQKRTVRRSFQPAPFFVKR
ncbi:hypothetical protein CONLIGDRAFT_684597 [Coniochaeta ligniaria NRRL 30616]|uniref:Uncharacterized protein n=1 Tax=Coniochaeta ligniaria NRRL 30616 TaxID=1408157 RepID=A0A1J7JA26_9PEZI|nr:hypothetical protein CONLIGDRAFT_684597 [Coniochaeta ligniaria NRRL 30616]